MRGGRGIQGGRGGREGTYEAGQTFSQDKCKAISPLFSAFYFTSFLSPEGKLCDVRGGKNI